MTLNKLLCIGGGDNGKFVEHKEVHQIFIDGMFLEPETYEPKNLINPVNGQKQLFYVLNGLTDSEASEILKNLIARNK
ncbi:hypothetical protein J532_2583 [Acinetobacter baumannii 940793]|nr:hypothetical protein J494_1817 [Acinetobacter baumannii 29280]EXG15759.1 hypothetical protein J727_1045 [Acinetobacter baumannii 472237-120]EXH09013.1 hypothetical protein J641_3328 [Acinetobacter baumannii 1188188]EXH19401.1 hypothetical protein J636_0571 [Acinetobacter baumannii 1271213]EXH27319.1 hypothetical protein J643_0744 [Acinetobacter baumannii 1237893]EXI08568.1 hypothetical protein J644_0999 [Acinetobacter baumannii 480175]EXR35953.1 hypothetical protein J668_3375 [Acinetobacte